MSKEPRYQSSISDVKNANATESKYIPKAESAAYLKPARTEVTRFLYLSKTNIGKIKAAR